MKRKRRFIRTKEHRCNNFDEYYYLFSSSRVENRAATRRRHFSRSLASLQSLPQIKPISWSSALIVLCQVCFGHPGLYLPTGVHFNTVSCCSCVSLLHSQNMSKPFQAAPWYRAGYYCCLFIGKDLCWTLSEANRCWKSSADIHCEMHWSCSCLPKQ